MLPPRTVATRSAAPDRGPRRRLRGARWCGATPVELPAETDSGAIERGEVTVSYLSRLQRRAAPGPRRRVDAALDRLLGAGSYTPGMTEPTIDRTAEWDDLRDRYLAAEGRAAGDRPPGASTTRPSLSSDVARTIEFYQGLLGFPLTDLFENRDYPGSTHFFFDIGHGNALAFFDFPGLDARAVRGGARRPPPPGHQRRAGAVAGAQGASRRRWHRVPRLASGVSLYFRGPDGERLELLADPLGEMYGQEVL